MIDDGKLTWDMCQALVESEEVCSVLAIHQKQKSKSGKRAAERRVMGTSTMKDLCKVTRDMKLELKCVLTVTRAGVTALTPLAVRIHIACDKHCHAMCSVEIRHNGALAGSY